MVEFLVPLVPPLGVGTGNRGRFRLVPLVPGTVEVAAIMRFRRVPDVPGSRAWEPFPSDAVPGTGRDINAAFTSGLLRCSSMFA